MYTAAAALMRASCYFYAGAYWENLWLAECVIVYLYGNAGVRGIKRIHADEHNDEYPLHELPWRAQII